jgi:hypothetical protein
MLYVTEKMAALQEKKYENNNRPRRKDFKKVCSEIKSLIYILLDDGLVRPKHVVTILIF